MYIPLTHGDETPIFRTDEPMNCKEIGYFRIGVIKKTCFFDFNRFSNHTQDMFKKIIRLFFILVILGSLAGGGVLYWFIALHPGPEIERENIRRILGKESPVYYSDGKTRLGVFFDKAHRQYVGYSEIPVNFINAMVASEDNRFFSHFGFDIPGIGRAAIKNIQARRVVQGGSTLTQQTAKNLFERADRSFAAKLKELLFALRLEYHYDKEEIFEFYANQFFVSGNAHGLGVAARYYFDKFPSELNLLECAFIAGSVKNPNSYNPFIKKSKKSVDAARERGKKRVGYVLKKMYELEMIGEEQYKTALASDVGFKKGKVGFALDHVMEMVRNAVSTNEVLEGLAAHNISNLATSGVRVITTVDKELQRKTLYALRHDLSRLDVRLRGYEREKVQKELAALDYRGDRQMEKMAFLFGKVKEVVTTEKDMKIIVDFGEKLAPGYIDRDGLKRIVAARVRWHKNPWTDVKKEDYSSLLKQFQEGDKVWVSVRDFGDDGVFLLDLEKFPKVNGGALVLQDGVVKAMAGGVENRFFNRAIDAQRTMGSSFKPLVFSAALQLGWNAADNLSNKRAVFVYQGQPYFPRPDHHSPHANVSMSWAGVHSENVASVWLLSHLCDKLSQDQFREVAAKLDLTPRIVDGDEESYTRYRSRIRDKYGIVIDRDTLQQAAFGLALQNVESDFVFEGRAHELDDLNDLHYGKGFKRFQENINAKLKDKKKKLKKSSRDELRLRKKLLSKNYLHLATVRSELKLYRQEIEEQLWQFYSQRSGNIQQRFSKRERYRGLGKICYDRVTGKYSFYTSLQIPPNVRIVGTSELLNVLSVFNDDEKRRFWGNIRLQSLMTAGAFDLLKMQVGREYDRLKEFAPYSIDALENIQDFRILVGLHYLIDFSKKLGVKSKLEPVLSFPLGANVITLLEAVRMYEGLVTGQVVIPDEKSNENGDVLTILDRIESADGRILYQPVRKKRTLLAPETTISLGHILENIVKFGTGRYANKNVRLFAGEHGGDTSQQPSFSIPLLGKTGTANRYTNASFFGYLPGLSEQGDALIGQNGFAVGVYVGYDNNAAMRKGATKITGSAGALPTWSDIVTTILTEKGYEKNLDPVDLTFYGLIMKREPLGQLNVTVSEAQGGRVTFPALNVDEIDRYRPSIMTFGYISEGGEFQGNRYFQPYWKQFSEIYQ
jgi:penicillin-binding protein 1A